MKTRKPNEHVKLAHAHLTKAYTQLSEVAGRVSGNGDVALFAVVKRALDAVEAAWKASATARTAVGEAHNVGLQFDSNTKVEGLFRVAHESVVDVHRGFYEYDRGERRARLQASSRALDELGLCGLAELQEYFHNRRRLDELLEVYRVADSVKQLRIVERGGGRPTSGDADLFADGTIRRVLQLKTKISHQT